MTPNYKTKEELLLALWNIFLIAEPESRSQTSESEECLKWCKVTGLAWDALGRPEENKLKSSE